MKRTLTLIIAILLVLPLVSAHGIEKGPIIQSTEAYNLQFSTEPTFPVTGKESHLDITIHDKAGNPLSGLNTQVELHNSGQSSTISLEEDQGHYSSEYTFRKKGIYNLDLIINNEELEAEFNLEVDNFGLSGILRSLLIVFLLELLLIRMIIDCKKGKKKRKRRRK